MDVSKCFCGCFEVFLLMFRGFCGCFEVFCGCFGVFLWMFRGVSVDVFVDVSMCFCGCFGVFLWMFPCLFVDVSRCLWRVGEGWREGTAGRKGV